MSAPGPSGEAEAGRDPRINPCGLPRNLLLPPLDDRSFGDRVFELRDALGLSQDQVAYAAGIRRWSLGRWERKKAIPTSLASIAALADVLGADRAELARRALRDFERREGAEPT
ncbi:hypothetical protein GCM10027258_93350 [Amycolatopsis stemonae]